MRPRNDFERKVVQVHKSLRKIKKNQIDWLVDKAFTKESKLSRNRLFCLECGYKWPTVLPENDHVVCPSCKQTLTRRDNSDKSHKTALYGQIITTYKGFQVVRTCIMNKYTRLNYPAEHFVHEVMQQWISPKGKVANITREVQGLSAYYDAWSIGSGMALRGPSYRANLRHQIAPDIIYHRKIILPEIKRNGFNGDFHDIAPQLLFHAILFNPKMEIIFKSRNILLFKGALYHEYIKNDIEKYWSSLRITIKHKYQIEDIKDWLDYIKLLEYFGKDILNPKYICPANLKKEHNKYVSKKRKQMHKEKIKELIPNIEKDNPEYVKQKQKFFDIIITNGKITVRPLKSVWEFLSEDETMAHCIFISGYHKRKDSLILTSEEDGIPLETIEVSLKNFTILQARGLLNVPTEKHDEIITLVNNNMDIIKKKSRSREKISP